MVVLLAVGAWAAFHFFASSSNNNGGTTSKHSAAPTVTLNIPSSNLELTKTQGFFEISANISSGSLVSRVEFLVDNKVVATSVEAPYRVTIDISDMAVGQHTLKAVAYNASGKVGESDTFTFIIKAGDEVVPADDESQATVDNSGPISAQVRTTTRTTGKSTPSSGSNNNNGSGNNNGGNNGGDGGNGGNTTWPATPPAQICGSAMLNNGPTSAPIGATSVAAGDNSTVDFTVPGQTYWFAPGVHKLAQDQFAQIAPGNDATFIGAPGAVLDGASVNNYAFTGHATNVKIQYLTIQNFVSPRDEGVVNHNSGADWKIQYNTVQNNKGGAVFAGTNNNVSYNCLKDNGQYGFQVYSGDPGGPTNVTLDHNEITGNNTDDWEAQINGCGCTGGGKFWEAHNVTVTNNYVHGNLSVGLWADTNDTDFLIDGNYISDNKSQGLFYEISYNMIVRNNNFLRNGLVDGAGNNSFPTGAIYLSEAGGDSRVAGRTHEIEIYNNNFENNWAGVILWENADRFCNSPANTSSGTCTMVNPNANLTTCNDPALGGSINQQPYKSDCRWKTQNVKVHNNIFKTIKSDITGCTDSSSCGYQGIFSNVGTFPSWSPYMGSGIQTDITFNQNNTFSSNTYLGDWRFKGKDQSNNFNFAVWQSSPFNQDVGSTYNGQDHLVVANAFDDDTSTIEGSKGMWTDWFSVSTSQSTAEAHSGTHSLKVSITAPFGWGVQLTNSNGPAITPSAKNISYWVKLGSGTNLKSQMDVKWLDENGNLIDSSTNVVLSSPVLTNSWQQVSTVAPVTPPAGARYANVTLLNDAGAAGTTGNAIYFDDFVMADAS